MTIIQKNNLANTTNSYYERLVPDEVVWYNRRMLVEHQKRYVFAQQYVGKSVVLDVACGSGYGTRLLARSGAKVVYGIDISSDAIKYAKERYRHEKVKYLVGSGLELPFKKNVIDVVVSFETIEHIDEINMFTREIRRVLKKNGIFIVSTPNKILGTERVNPFHKREFYLDEFKKLVEKYFRNVELFGQGLVPIRYVKWVERIVSIIPPGKLRWVMDSIAKYPFRSTNIYRLAKQKLFTPGYFIAIAYK